jgi:hypothetical protein
MELKYVGAKPKVSGKGVTFDQTKPDRYTFLTAAVELLEALSFEVTEDTVGADERRAWLGNIEIMRDYYLQYITNESAYQCALDALADKIHQSHIEEVTFPLGRNHGLVLSHLVDVLRDHRPPYDATLSFETKEGETFGKLDMNRAVPLDI